MLALVVDDLGLSFESTVAVRKALKRFVDRQVEPGDLVAILRTAGGIGALQQFTTDRRLMHAAADRVQWTILSRSGAERRAAYARALLFIDANGVAFVRGDDGRHEAKLDVLQVAVGDNGALLADWRRTITLSLSDEQLRDAKARGVVYSTRMPVKKPGAYQVRVAIRDMSTAALGSASQFLEIPEIGKGRLAVSGVLVRAAEGQASPAETAATDLAREGDGERLSGAALGEPSVRIFEPGSGIVYAYEIYDGLRGDEAERLEMSTSLLRDGRVVYESPWAPVKAARGANDLRVLPVAGQLSLGADVPPGTYTLQVSVTADRKRRAAQWADFQVRGVDIPE